MSADPIIDLVPDGVRIRVRLTPRAGADRLAGLADTPAGPALKALVAAPPEAGRANAALVALLAAICRVPRRDIAIVGGRKSRDKLVQVGGAPETLRLRLSAALAASPGRG